MTHAVFMYALIAILGAFLGFANPVISAPGLVLFFPMGLALIARHAPTPGAAFKRAWLTGGLGYAASLYWIAVPVTEFGGLPWALSAPLPVLLGLCCGLYSGVFGWLLRLAEGRLPWSLWSILAGCLWAGLEAARGYLLTGFPWQSLPSALAGWPWAIQGVAFVGAYGLAGFFAGVAALPASGGPAWRTLVLAAFCLSATAWWGEMRVSEPVPAIGRFDALLVQGNVNQAVKWNAAYQESTAAGYLDLTRRAIEEAERSGKKPDLAVWPETAMPFFLSGPPEAGDPQGLAVRLREAIAGLGVATYVGAPGMEPPSTAGSGAPGGTRYFNRAHLVGPDGALLGAYDKTHLVPFGEYVPYQWLFFFVNKLTEAVGDFYPGESFAPLKVRLGAPQAGQAGEIAAGGLICYEAIFPEIAQQAVAAGATVLVNISNDAWFGLTSAPRQHLDASALRAVEQGRWLLRATNTGVSAAFDARGRKLVSLGLSETGTLRVPDVGLVAETTFYHRHFLALTAAPFAMAGLLLIVAMFRKRRPA